MAKVIEEQLFKCKSCKRRTKHLRNNTKSSGFMILVHLILTIATFGIWLLLVILFKLLTFKIGGWKCEICGKRYGIF